MTENTPRQQARQLLEQAAALPIRGELKTAIQSALDIASRTKRGLLTDVSYRNLKPGDRLLDPERPGFLMRATKTKKAWYYRWRHPDTGLQVETALGTYPQVSLEEARRLWEPLRAGRLQGELPGASAHDNKSTTIRELVDKYVREYAEVVKAESSALSDGRLLEQNLVQPFGGMAADEFGSAEVREILQVYAAEGKDRQAEKVRAVISTLFEVAAGRTRKISFLDGETWLPGDHKNPVEGVQLRKRTVASYKPTTAELRGYVRGLSKISMGELLRLQLLTCARIGEVCGLPWSELDLEAAEWNLPGSRTKNGDAHKVLLSTQAVELLNTLKARQDNDPSPFVFPQLRSRKHPVGTTAAQHALSDNRKQLKVSDGFTTHSIRHACLSWIAENGGTKDVRDRISNHRPPRSADAVYTQAKLNQPAREWLQKWADHLLALEDAGVVLLGEVRA